MFGLNIGDIIITFNEIEGWKEFPITRFYTDTNNNTWASLGRLTILEGFNDGYVSEQTVTDEIREDLLKLGWKVINNELD